VVNVVSEYYKTVFLSTKFTVFCRKISDEFAKKQRGNQMSILDASILDIAFLSSKVECPYNRGNHE
tara:strand:+ start:43 stop:240 length:198 start_codon:yes stop_codon:yes gene_type:complete